MMRIITGTARGVKLRTLPGEDTRPTAERTKEAIFSMIQFELNEKRVLDAFAGSGQMGLEALSRGSRSALFIDTNKAATEVIDANVELTRMKDRAEVVCGDLFECLRRRLGRERFDIVFLDPPYRSELIKRSLEFLTDHQMLSDNALVICESAETIGKLLEKGEDILQKFTVIKNAKYGIARVAVLRYTKEEDQI